MDLDHLPFFQDEFDLSVSYPDIWTLILSLARDLSAIPTRDSAADRVAEFISATPSSEDDMLERDLMLPVASRRLGYLLQTGPQSAAVRNAMLVLQTAVGRMQDVEYVVSFLPPFALSSLHLRCENKTNACVFAPSSPITQRRPFRRSQRR